MRDKLIRMLVKSLHESYPHCNRKNVLTDPVYGQLALKVLDEALDHASTTWGPTATAIRSLMTEVKCNLAPAERERERL